MPTSPFDELTDAWEVSNRHTAAADQDILLTNTSGYVAYFEITTTDDLPGVHVRKAHPVRPGRSVPMQLMAGERHWFAGVQSHVSVLVP